MGKADQLLEIEGRLEEDLGLGAVDQFVVIEGQILAAPYGAEEEAVRRMVDLLVGIDDDVLASLDMQVRIGCASLGKVHYDVVSDAACP